MKIQKKLAAIAFALIFFPALALAQEVKEFQGRIKSKSATEVVAESKDEGEKTFVISDRTQGTENATEGARVTIKYSERDGQLRVREIAPRQ